jgi:DNA-binding NarL/FixJ family response regulator
MKVDWISVLEAVAVPAASDDEWGSRIVEAALPIFHAEAPCVFVNYSAISHRSDCSSMASLMVAGQRTPAMLVGHAEHAAMECGPEWLKAMYYPPHMACTHSEVIATLDPRMADRLRALQTLWGVVDAIGVLVHPEPGMVGILCAGTAKPKRLNRHERASLTRIGLHIENAWRLRRHPERILAVVDPSGKVVHCMDGSPNRDELSASVRSIERARTRRHRSNVEALELWRALIAGRASLIERSEQGRRRYFVMENPPPAQPMRAFTPGEVDVVSYAARGLPAKLIGYALGVGDASVSRQLASAAGKVGVATRMELVRIAAMLVGDPRARFDDIALTTAERHVLELLDQGLSNQAIARIRSSSVRTIANQVAGLLKKTGAPSRRALVARARG